MSLLEKLKNLIKDLKDDAKNINDTGLNVLFLGFTFVCYAMAVINFLNNSERMVWTSGIAGSCMLILMLLYYVTKKRLLAIGGMYGIVLSLAFLLVVEGGEQGFGIIWLLLIPYLAVFALRLYYGGIFGLLLALIPMVYMWTPLHGLGYSYPEIYRVRFPLAYMACYFLGIMMQLQVFQSHKKEKEFYKSVEEANQVKSVFLSNMSHEARTPINAVLGYNEMILKESKESNTIACATNIQAAARTLLSIVSDTLDFTNIQEGTLYLEHEKYSILSVLQDLTTYGNFSAEKKKLDFRIDIAEDLPQELIGDAIRLTQVCKNLISNAIKYTNSGYILLEFGWRQLEKKKGMLLVRVKDTGIGIREEDIEKLGTSFTRIDERNTKNIQGVGLGLPLVMKLLRMMGSELEITSTYGSGSEFSFALVQEVASFGVIGKQELAKHETEGLEAEQDYFTAADARILIVDDNMMNLDLLKGMLKRREVAADLAMNGEEAIAKIRENTYDLIFMDHMMPVLDGMEALRQIQDENLCPGVPIVVLTANAVAGAKEMYLEAGFRAYLSKPVTSKAIYAMLKDLLPPDLIVRGRKTETKETSVVQAATEESKSLLERLDFLDTAMGLEYCCASEDFYKEMLKSYVDSEKLEDIEAYYEVQDWENYRIRVHALKSSSLSIGAVELSEQAKQLELAAKEENHYFIDSHHDAAMKEYRRILDGIRDALSDKKVEVQTAVVIEKSEHILVVDDDPMNLRIAERMLGDRFELGLVSSGKEALAYVEKQVPTLILLDLHMPEMDGFEVMEKLKELPRVADVPVVFLTADNDREVEVRGFKMGAQDFITKPFVADIMIQRVSRILELSRLQKDLQSEVEKQTYAAEERRQKLERLSDQIMKTLADTIDAKDSYTNGHSLRVAQYSLELAKRAGKDEKEQERIYFMGMLHDIGKIGIPDSIITKQSSLSDEEYSVTRLHPVIGAEILENISEIPDLGVGARWHHERYDGKGYPDGLAGENIPEEARMIAVADAYDAMASKRSYRDVLPQQVVYEEIKKGRGTQFDPVFAELMLRMMEEDKEYTMCEK